MPPQCQKRAAFSLVFVKESISILIYFFFFYICLFTLIFHWRKIALQCCDSSCHTTVQTSHNYTFITSLLSLPPFLYIPPLQFITELLTGLPVLDSNFSAAIYFTHDSVYTSMLLLSHVSRVRLCATPQTAAHQALQSLGFSRQEHWSGLPFPSPVHESEK